MFDAPSTRITLIAKLSDRNDIVAWDEFIRIYEPVIYRMARGRGMQDADARELTQEILITVAKLAESRELATFRSFRRWLAVTTRNRVIDAFRKEKTRSKVAGDLLRHSDAAPEEALLESQWSIELRREMFAAASRTVQSQIPAQQWNAFWQTAIEMRTAADVARRLGMSIGHVYVARCRVMERLRKTVERLSLEDSES